MIDDKNNIYGFQRSYNGQSVYVFLNNGITQHQIEVKLCNGKNAYDLLNEKSYSSNKGDMKLQIEEKWGALLICQ